MAALEHLPADGSPPPDTELPFQALSPTAVVAKVRAMHAAEDFNWWKLFWGHIRLNAGLVAADLWMERYALRLLDMTGWADDPVTLADLTELACLRATGASWEAFYAASEHLWSRPDWDRRGADAALMDAGCRVNKSLSNLFALAASHRHPDHQPRCFGAVSLLWDLVDRDAALAAAVEEFVQTCDDA